MEKEKFMEDSVKQIYWWDFRAADNSKRELERQKVTKTEWRMNRKITTMEMDEWCATPPMKRGVKFLPRRIFLMPDEVSVEEVADGAGSSFDVPESFKNM